MDHSPIKQTFELGKFISTAGKSILNLIKLRSLVAKYRKMWKIRKSCEVCEFCILLNYARKSVTTFHLIILNLELRYKRRREPGNEVGLGRRQRPLVYT